MFDPDRRLRRINRGLTILILAVTIYLIVTPLLVPAQLWMGRFSGKQEQLQRQIQDGIFATNAANQVLIPKIQLTAGINESTNSQTLQQGIWRLPSGSTPDKGGNTVLLGQRFSYSQPRGIFYALDKVPLGSKIGVIWNHKLYRYTVIGNGAVDSNSAEVTAPTTVPTLTLYTSNPVLWPSNQLVVTAQLEGTP